MGPESRKTSKAPPDSRKDRKMSLLALLGLRFLWQKVPGLPSALVFWSYSFFLRFTDPSRSKWTFWLTFAGALSNATVTLANMGYMPVIGKGMGSAISVWTPATVESKLLLLADRTAWWGCSIGDFLIAAGILALFVT